MSPGEVPRRAVLLLVAAAALLCLPNMAAAESTLVAPLPLQLEGDIDSASTASVLRIGADENGAPPGYLSLLFTAAEARVTRYNYSTTATAAGTVPALGRDPLADNSGGAEVLPNALYNTQFLIKRLRSDFLFVVDDGAKAGAEYRTFPTETPAQLDVTVLEQVLSNAEEPQEMDINRPIPAHTFRLSADGMRYEIEGDFRFMIHGAELTTVSPEDVTTYRTGTWISSQEAGTGPVPTVQAMTTTTTEWVQVEVTDALLTLAASGGQQDLFAAAESIALHIDGAITANGAAGSLTIGEQVVRSTGEKVRAEGDFHLTPTYVLPGTSKQVVFAMEGQYEQLSVDGNSVFLSDDAALVAAATTGITALLVGAYFWPSAKSALFVPLYAKLTKTKVLDQETRNLVHQKVEADPGCQVKQVADELDISWTTAAYHLRVLRKMGLIVAKRMGRHEHYFVAGSRAAAGHQVISVLQNATAKTILEAILRHPGIIQKDLCELLAIAPSTASGHLTRLRDVGAIREQRDWKVRRYFVGDAIHELPIHVGVNAPLAEPTAAAVPAS